MNASCDKTLLLNNLNRNFFMYKPNNGKPRWDIVQAALRAEIENMPNPNNPKSSYMASLSAIATLKRIVNPIQIGA